MLRYESGREIRTAVAVVGPSRVHGWELTPGRCARRRGSPRADGALVMMSHLDKLDLSSSIIEFTYRFQLSCCHGEPSRPSSSAASRSCASSRRRAPRERVHPDLRARRTARASLSCTSCLQSGDYTSARSPRGCCSCASSSRSRARLVEPLLAQLPATDWRPPESVRAARGEAIGDRLDEFHGRRRTPTAAVLRSLGRKGQSGSDAILCGSSSAS